MDTWASKDRSHSRNIYSWMFLLLILLVSSFPLAATEAPADIIIDNTDSNTSKSGWWPAFGWLSSKTYGHDYYYSWGGSGGNTFKWMPIINKPGIYRVFVRWNHAFLHATK